MSPMHQRSIDPVPKATSITQRLRRRLELLSSLLKNFPNSKSESETKPQQGITKETYGILRTRSDTTSTAQPARSTRRLRSVAAHARQMSRQHRRQKWRISL